MFLSAFLGSYHVLIASTNEHFHGAACAEGEDALAAQCSEAVSRDTGTTAVRCTSAQQHAAQLTVQPGQARSRLLPSAAR